MPISYRIDDEAGLVYFVAIGATAESDWVDTRARAREHPRYRPGMSLLIDARRHESLLSTDFLTHLATSPKSRSRPDQVPSWAIVVSREVEYGLGRMFSLFAECTQVDVRVFRDIDKAEKWLNEVRLSRSSVPAAQDSPCQQPAG